MESGGNPGSSQPPPVKKILVTTPLELLLMSQPEKAVPRIFGGESQNTFEARITAEGSIWTRTPSQLSADALKKQAEPVLPVNAKELVVSKKMPSLQIGSCMRMCWAWISPVQKNKRVRPTRIRIDFISGSSQVLD